MGKLKYFIHDWIWVFMLLFIILGLMFPPIGIIALICMLAPVIVSFFRGRFWCGYFCPRGSLNDKIIAKISNKMKIPKIFKNIIFRITFLVILMSFFAIQIYFSFGNLYSIGTVFLRMIIITTSITILLGIIYQPRTWCTFCPMGTLAHFVTKHMNKQNKYKNNHNIKINSEECINCSKCTKNCPIGINVIEFKKYGELNHPDCLKCETCINVCPKNALTKNYNNNKFVISKDDDKLVI